jgi:hypothetical protein
MGATLSLTVTTSQATTWALVLVSAAILLLVALDRFKSVRPLRVPVRGRRQPQGPLVVVTEPSIPFRGTPWWRRVLSLGGIGIITAVLGVVVAIVVAAAVVATLLVLGGLGA